MAPWPTIVAHLDLDCFFAQVVELDHPEYRGRPVIVGGGPRPDGSFGRGVVCTSNYLARSFGVRTAMPIAQAARLCPDAVITHAAHGRYSEVSSQVMAVCQRFTPAVNVVGIDEAYLGLEGLERWSRGLLGRAEGPAPRERPEFWDTDWPIEFARHLQQVIRDETAMSASIGIGPNRFIAKIASGYLKPAGITCVRPGNAARFIAGLPLRRLRGVGPVTEQKLRRRGYTHASHIVNADPEQLLADLGEWGVELWHKARGEHGTDPLHEQRERKSISRERTFSTDIRSRDDLVTTLHALTARATFTLREKGLRAGCVSIKLRYDDFTTFTRDRSLADAAAGAIGATDHDADLLPVIEALLDELIRSTRRRLSVRLVGVKLSHLAPGSHRQMRLDEGAEYDKRSALYAAADAIRARHGFDAISSARACHERKRPANFRTRHPDAEP
ncbi:MAG: DNA polymerase IV [Phycisphaerales bacterium]|nr:DNA polymerase IV [Phycisphaerales bacterium]